MLPQNGCNRRLDQSDCCGTIKNVSQFQAEHLSGTEAAILKWMLPSDSKVLHTGVYWSASYSDEVEKSQDSFFSFSLKKHLGIRKHIGWHINAHRYHTGDYSFRYSIIKWSLLKKHFPQIFSMFTQICFVLLTSRCCHLWNFYSRISIAFKKIIVNKDYLTGT